MTPNTLSPEESREPQTLRNLFLRDEIIRSFRLTDDEFSDLKNTEKLASMHIISPPLPFTCAHRLSTGHRPPLK